MPPIAANPVPVPMPAPKPHTEPMPEAEHTNLRAYLATAGLKPTDVQAAVGPAAAGKTRYEIEQALTTWLSTRPKG